MSYPYTIVPSQNYGNVGAVEPQIASGRAERRTAGDWANGVLVDLAAFVSLFIGLGFPWWSAALIGSPNSFIDVADLSTGTAWFAVLSIAVVLLTRSRLRLLDHAGDASRLAGASFIAAFVVTMMLAANFDTGHVVAAFVVALSSATSTVACRRAIGLVINAQTKLGHLKRRVAIYGATEESAQCLAHLAGNKDTALLGLFDNRKGTERVRDFGIEIKGSLDDLAALVAAGGVDEVIIAMPAYAKERAVAIAERLSDYPVHLRSPAALASIILSGDERFQVSRLGNVELADVATRPLKDWNIVLKALQDRVGAVVLLALFAPIMLIIALAIKLDSRGPVFFRQRRHGLCGQTIIVWKFRTMSVLEDGGIILQAQSRDPRITRVGRVLRKSSLDELPQLINVVLGDMSLVGPRPHALAHNEHYAQLIRTYNGRHRLKPGITGWAQINGLRGEVREPSEMQQRVEHDHWYIQNYSIWLDLKILMLTPIYGFFNRNAY